MLGSFPQPSHMPCPDCGASVRSGALEQHACDRERRADYELFQLRDGIDGFEDELAAYLASPRGRFAVWDAERRRP